MGRKAPAAGRKVVHASPEALRRLVVTKQRLAGKLPSPASQDAIVSVVGDLGYVQWDPVSIVAPSHVISLWARVGPFKPSDLDDLLWRQKRLFEHWTPMASIVRTEDYPLYSSLMRRYPDSLTHSWGNHRARAKKFLAQNSRLRRKVLRELGHGPLRIDQFEDHSRSKRNDGEWSESSDVSLMLFHLTMSGDVMVVGHEGNQNVWGLAKEFLPSWVDRTRLTREEFERAAAQRAIQALGAATPREITYYFVRGRYEDLRKTLAGLEAESLIHRLVVDGIGPRDERYVHEQDLALLESAVQPLEEPRMTLLSPFDNLIYSQSRGNLVFGFDYIREQFLPKERRRFGTYVLPILHGDALIGRIDPRFDKERHTLEIQAIHLEPRAPRARSVGAELARTIEGFAEFLGAAQVLYTKRVPSEWKSLFPSATSGS